MRRYHRSNYIDGNEMIPRLKRGHDSSNDKTTWCLLFGWSASGIHLAHSTCMNHYQTKRVKYPPCCHLCPHTFHREILDQIQYLS